MRPGKFRFVAEMQFIGLFIRPNVSTGPPRQAAHDAFSVICTPPDSSALQTVAPPIFVFCNAETTSRVAGTPKVSISTLLPWRISAKARKSEVLPPVHEPM